MNTNYNTIVYGKTLQRAMNILDTLLKDTDREQIRSLRRTTYVYEVILKDGTYYKAMMCNEGCRGYRFQRAVVDCLIDDRDVHELIEPNACCSELPKDEQIIKSDILYF